MIYEKPRLVSLDEVSSEFGYGADCSGGSAPGSGSCSNGTSATSKDCLTGTAADDKCSQGYGTTGGDCVTGTSPDPSGTCNTGGSAA